MVQQMVQGVWLCHGAANGARSLVVPWCSKRCKEFGCAVVQQTVQGVWLCHGAANGARGLAGKWSTQRRLTVVAELRVLSSFH